MALAEGVQVINLSFHSPSLAVGHTPYVRDEGQLDALYAWLQACSRILMRRAFGRQLWPKSRRRAEFMCVMR